MKKNTILFVCCILLGTTLSAQFNERPVLNLQNEDMYPLNWGYFLGFNQYDFKFEYIDDKQDRGNNTDILVGKSLGFNVGLIGELRINNHLDLRFEPGLHYNRRELGFPDFVNSEKDGFREVKSTYLHFPLLLKVSTKRLGNWKPFLTGGVSTSLNLSSNEDSKDDNSSNRFRMKKNTYYYEMGFGIDFYLEYFKFSPSIRGIFAINDELVRDNSPNSPWTGNIDAMKTRGLFVNFTFE
ncbi:type IX secretion/gliding motility protein PorT/SprT [Arenibacter certesii]|nr:porin family protein [Arenibacter certesii]